MAATISINFANEQDVYDESLDTVLSREKKSISAKTLQDVLGGGVVSGGYVRKTGDAMTGFLTLTSAPPSNPFHAATKSYVDSHAYTRRYYYKVITSSDNQYVNGLIRPGTRAVSGVDLYTNPLYFFDKGDVSELGVTRYLDVYRDGILQAYGSNNDYIIRSIPTTTFQRGVTAVEFVQPLEEGTNIQISIGSAGAYPVTFGVNFLSGFMGIAVSSLSGDVTLSAVPIHFAATRGQVATPQRRDVFVSPVTLSGYPLMFQAKGIFRKDVDNNYSSPSTPREPTDRYGSVTGEYVRRDPYTYNIVSVKSDPDALPGNSISPALHRVTFPQGIFTSTLYHPIVTIGLHPPSVLDNWQFNASAFVVSESRTLTSFDFLVADNVFDSPPFDIYEISISVI